MLRSPVVCILAHVDHGKTSILDKIRGTAVASKEAGGITQMIGAYYIPRPSIIAACGPLAARADELLKVPGLLFIDTPGHEAFTSMRERGGSIADIAILVVDLMQGIQPQTVESINILRANKTPFVVALNKVDLLQGWKSQDTPSISQSLAAQTPAVQTMLEDKLYTLVGRLSEIGLQAERFDRVNDFTKQLAMVPLSAKTGEGIAELLMMLSGLSQKFLSAELQSQLDGPAKGSIIEVKEEKGLGTTLDVIIYDGTLHKNDLIVFGTANGARAVKVRGILRPPRLGETAAPGSKLIYIDDAPAASGVKIYAPGLEGALAGSPIRVVPTLAQVPVIEIEITAQIKQVLISQEALAGVVVKTDTLGSAEALMRLLNAAGMKVREVGVGPVSKKDVISAHTAGLQDKYVGVVLAFNVPVAPDALEEATRAHVPLFTSPIIYRLLEDYANWATVEKAKELQAAMSGTVLPAKILVLPNCFFRLSKPAVFGVEVTGGRLRAGTPLMNERGEIIGEVKQIQVDAKPVEQLAEKQQAAISVPEAYCGKTFKEGDTLFAFINKGQAALLRTKAASALSEKEKALLEQIMVIEGERLI
ncbi:MAG: translation initiation factor IF-2 [Candidatus Micrarchaeota archaeon]|nr:translation initiation factor IF-2 [Candidatus Micrarchaeota archaeon]